MNPLERLYAIVLLALFACSLPGCATFEKCGYGCPPDRKLTANIRQKLGSRGDYQVYVQAQDGVVFLSGLVYSDLELQDAESVVRDTPGVTRVVNMLAVSNS